jgi:hypothetical protein
MFYNMFLTITTISILLLGTINVKNVNAISAYAARHDWMLTVWHDEGEVSIRLSRNQLMRDQSMVRDVC